MGKTLTGYKRVGMRKLDFAVSVDEITRHQEEGVASVEGGGFARHDTAEATLFQELPSWWLAPERLLIEQCFENMYQHLCVFSLLPN
jgi:hypothetical protein